MNSITFIQVKFRETLTKDAVEKLKQKERERESEVKRVWETVKDFLFFNEFPERWWWQFDFHWLLVVIVKICECVSVNTVYIQYVIEIDKPQRIEILHSFHEFQYKVNVNINVISKLKKIKIIYKYLYNFNLKQEIHVTYKIMKYMILLRKKEKQQFSFRVLSAEIAIDIHYLHYVTKYKKPYSHSHTYSIYIYILLYWIRN